MKWNKAGDNSTLLWGQDILEWVDNKPVLIKNNDRVTVSTNSPTYWLPIHKPGLIASNFVWSDQEVPIHKLQVDKYLLVHGYKDKANMVREYGLFLTKWVMSRGWPFSDSPTVEYRMEDNSITARYYCIVEPPPVEVSTAHVPMILSLPVRNRDAAYARQDHDRLITQREPKIGRFPSIDFYHEVRRYGRKVSSYIDGEHGEVYFYKDSYYDTKECVVAEPGKLAVRYSPVLINLPHQAKHIVTNQDGSISSYTLTKA